MWSQLRGFLLDNKVCAPILKLDFREDLFHNLDTNSLVIFNVSSVLNGVKSGTLKPMAVRPLVDAGTFSSKIALTRRNVTIRSCWAAGLVVMKPNTARMTSLRQQAGTIPISEIPQVASIIWKAHKKYGRWIGSTKGQMLLAIHPSGEVITSGPPHRPRLRWSKWGRWTSPTTFAPSWSHG